MPAGEVNSGPGPHCLATTVAPPLHSDPSDPGAPPAAALAAVQARGGLSDVELARIFRTPRPALASWRRHGIPRADAHRLQLVGEVLDALESSGHGHDLPAALRRPLNHPGRPSPLDLLTRHDTSGVTAYLMTLHPERALTGRSVPAP